MIFTFCPARPQSTGQMQMIRTIVPDVLTLNEAVGVEEGGEGLGYAGGVIDEDRGVGAPGGYGQGHGHAVVVGGGIFTTFQEMAVQEAALY